MSFILGIDTGGTYTDGVVVDMETKDIISKAKALTTKEDLSIGIGECMDKLALEEPEQIKMVSISTTLATNAIVEGRGAATGLIYMGTEPDIDIPAEVKVKIRGRMSIMGDIAEDLDLKEVDEVIETMRGKVDAIAVSGYASVRNPKHEKQVMAEIREKLAIPVVGAHQLTTSLGFDQRTITAVLNGRLIPVIDELLKATAETVRKRGIDAPIMVVKGDGTLMTEKPARERPIETILSGPAASVIGALALTGNKEGIVLDMGGTTSDYAEIADGRVRIGKEGAKVGGWHTRVKAVEISTFGLGGDSLIALDKKGKLGLRTRKVWPLCVIGARYPGLTREMRSFRREGEFQYYSEHEVDCYMYQGGSAVAARIEELSEKDKKVIEVLKDRPHSIIYIAEAIGQDPETVELGHLEEGGLIARISFTPTDLMHILGRYSEWNEEISTKAAQILAERMKLTLNQFVSLAESLVHDKLALTMMQSIADFEEEDMDIASSREAMMFLDRAIHKSSDSVFNIRMGLRKPVVAIGAPAEKWVVPAGEKLGVEVIVPEHAEVANAYGAASGQVIAQEELLITYLKGKYILNTSWERFEYTSKEEALFYATHEGRKQVEHTLRDAGCKAWNITEEYKDSSIQLRDGEESVYSATKVIITGISDALQTV